MFHNFDGLVAAVAAHRPQTLTGSSAVVGLEIDKRALGGGGAFNAGKFVYQSGAKGGDVAPTSLVLTVKVSHCDTSGGTFEDITDLQIVEAATKTLTDQNKIGSLALNLAGTKRFLKFVVTPAFTGGTNPNVLFSADLIVTDPKQI